MASERRAPAAVTWTRPPPARPARPGRSGGPRWRAAAPVVLLVMVLGALTLTDLGGPRAGGLGAGSGHQLGWQATGDRPSLQRAASAVPLGAPPDVSSVSGPYAFTRTQADGRTPVAYDPCRPIPVVINNRTAPPGGRDMVIEALAEVSRATGLRFVVEGTTSETPVSPRQPYQPELYGDRWAPVLIAWSDASEMHRLGPDTLGIGGSAWVPTAAGPDVYVTGIVALDGPSLAEYPNRLIRGTILHELGHLVGLAHVNDSRQLMYHGNEVGVTTFRGGDRVGLARLGAGACVGAL